MPPARLMPQSTTPGRILMTCDAVGGVWRYAVDLAAGLNRSGIGVILLGLGPEPSPAQRTEAEALPSTRLLWMDEPLDWMAERESEVEGLAARLDALAEIHDVDLLHLNLPSQAAGLRTQRPVLCVSHSCVATWWRAMRATPLPEAWDWLQKRNRLGFDVASVVLSPSESHGVALVETYGPIDGLRIVPNAWEALPAAPEERESFILAAGRWWDEGKNVGVLDEAAAAIAWPVLAAGALTGPQGQRCAPRHLKVRGELPGAEVKQLMERAGIFVSPSRFEPFGLAPLEAALRGAALVLSDIPTYRELWEGAAVFADPEDPASFAARINDLTENEAARKAVAVRCLSRAREFTPQRQLEALLEAYAAAVRRCRASQPLPQAAQ